MEVERKKPELHGYVVEAHLGEDGGWMSGVRWVVFFPYDSASL